MFINHLREEIKYHRDIDRARNFYTYLDNKISGIAENLDVEKALCVSTLLGSLSSCDRKKYDKEKIDDYVQQLKSYVKQSIGVLNQKLSQESTSESDKVTLHGALYRLYLKTDKGKEKANEHYKAMTQPPTQNTQ